MDTFYWLTAALIFAVSAICGTILLRERMHEKALAAYNVRREKEYRQIEKERDTWHTNRSTVSASPLTPWWP